MKNKNFIFLLAFFLLLIIPTISAFGFSSQDDDFLGTFKKNDCVDLYQHCDNCTYVNVTSIEYSNGTVDNIKESMTKDDVDYNYVFCNTSDLGNYYYTTKGDVDGVINTERLNFEITASGKEITTGKTFGSFGVLLGVFAVALVFLYIGGKLSQNDRTFPISFLFTIISVILIIYSLHLSWIISVYILQIETLSEGLSRVFVMVIWTSAGIAIITFALMLVKFIGELKNIVIRKKFGDDFDPIKNAY